VAAVVHRLWLPSPPMSDVIWTLERDEHGGWARPVAGVPDRGGGQHEDGEVVKI
jgi:hypothetical protein